MASTGSLTCPVHDNSWGTILRHTRTHARARTHTHTRNTHSTHTTNTHTHTTHTNTHTHTHNTHTQHTHTHIQHTQQTHTQHTHHTHAHTHTQQTTHTHTHTRAHARTPPFRIICYVITLASVMSLHADNHTLSLKTLSVSGTLISSSSIDNHTHGPPPSRFRIDHLHHHGH